MMESRGGSPPPHPGATIFSLSALERCSAEPAVGDK
jgi:hypothetical protein